MIILGLNGSAGAGKSTIARMLSRLCSAAVFDADREIHSMYLHDIQVVNLVKEYFPNAICEGLINKEELAKRFFSYGPLWRKFQVEIHKIVLQKQRDFISLHTRNGRTKYLVLDVPLLIENGLWRDCNFIIYVFTNPFLQQQRLMSRGMSWEQVRFLLSLQVSEGYRRKFADFKINTGCNSGIMSRQLLKIIEQTRSRHFATWQAYG